VMGLLIFPKEGGEEKGTSIIGRLQRLRKILEAKGNSYLVNSAIIRLRQLTLGQSTQEEEKEKNCHEGGSKTIAMGP